MGHHYLPGMGDESVQKWLEIWVRERYVHSPADLDIFSWVDPMQKERDYTTEIYSTLVERLCEQGLTPVEIPRLIKDIVHIIGAGEDFTVDSVNQGLELLGWKEQTLDTFRFELVLFILELEYDYEVK